MNVKSYLVAASLCLVSLCSQAGVIYQWTATNAETPWGISFEMEFDNRTVRNGEFKLDLAYDYGMGDATTVPAHGLLGLRYTFPGLSNKMDYTSKDQRGFSFERGFLNLDLKFGADGLLVGSIYANDTNSHIRLASIGSTFTVLEANSDEGMPWAGCSPELDMQCRGATGYFERVSHGHVPEPGSLALFGAGLFAASRFRSKAKA